MSRTRPTPPAARGRSASRARARVVAATVALGLAAAGGAVVAPAGGAAAHPAPVPTPGGPGSGGGPWLTVEPADTGSSPAAGYDAAADPGSLFRVADRIGADELPAHVTGDGVGVALIDTGVVDVPGLTEADVELGPDFSFEDVYPELRARDTMGHGTHLGGIIAARDGAWVAGDTQRRPGRLLGIAPDATLVSVKAGAADGAVDVSQVVAAINWVIANKDRDGRSIRVINLSYGTDSAQDYRLDPLAYAVERAWRAGIVVVVAGGNEGWDAPRLTNPAQDPFVLAVGSSEPAEGGREAPSSFSGGSADGRTVDLAAPGRSVVSLRAVGSASDAENEAGRVGDDLVRASGTSQAAAVVSGAVALLLSERPGLTPDQVKDVLERSAEPPAPGDAALAGSGYLRVDRALQAAASQDAQAFEPSTGSGTLDGARGSLRVAHEGVVLEGEVDVFGADWSASGWAQDSWSGARWDGGQWSGVRWSGAGWDTDRWAGTSWSGVRWSSDEWAGVRWSGVRWSGDGFTGVRWSGVRWSGDGFTGVRWSGTRWSGGGWAAAGGVEVAG